MLLARVLPLGWFTIMSDWVEKSARRLCSTLFEDCSRALLADLSVLLSPLLIMSIDRWQHATITDLEPLLTIDSVLLNALVLT